MSDLNSLPGERLFSRMFLLSRRPYDAAGWNRLSLGDYTLSTHPLLEVTTASHGERKIVFLGYCFDWRIPERSQQEMAQQIAEQDDVRKCIEITDEFSGRFVCIRVTPHSLVLFHDACGQREVFYETEFQAVGSQPKLIEKVIPGILHTDQDAKNFHQSAVFVKSGIFVGTYTQHENIRRLAPNHYLDLHAKKIFRFAPDRTINFRNVEDVADESIERLKGYLKAASLRYPLDMGVTAGYDSRVLFLAAVTGNIDGCNFYVGKNKSANNQTDIDIALQLGKLHQVPVKVTETTVEITEEAKAVQDASIDYPRYRQMSGKTTGRMIINGNVSEVARSYFGDGEGLTGVELSRMCSLGDHPFSVRVFNEWLTMNMPLFQQARYHYLDLFYWEERMGNWSAKGKTEAGLNVEVYSPFCARALLNGLLSTDRKHRDKHFNDLYDAIIRKMSPDAMKIPINPVSKVNTIRFLKRVGLYGIYRKYGIKFGILKR